MKPNCYECEYRGGVPGDCHSCCRHPEVGEVDMFMGLVKILQGEMLPAMEKLNIKGNLTGIRGGWFYWPVNFDPTWLENCEGFKQRIKW